MLTKIIRKLKEVLAHPSYTYQYLKKTFKTFHRTGGKQAIVNFDSNFRLDDFSRYLYALCIYLEKAGFQVFVKTGLTDYKMSFRGGYQHLIWKRDYIFIRDSSTPLNTIVLSQPNHVDRVLRFSYGFNVLKQEQFDCVAPYPMHPLQIKNCLNAASSAEPEKSSRSIKVLFSGSLLKDRYTGERIAKFFNYIPRLEVVDFVLSQFDQCSRLLKAESDKAALMQLLESNEFTNKIIISGVKTDPKDWLKILSRTDFFICPPGTKMPWCHNSVEAMSAGAIPILEYGSVFYPELENRKNCLCYTNYEELKIAIETALTLEPAEIVKMRRNVLDYYNTHLSVNSIAKQINKLAHAEKQEVKIAVPFVPLREERLVARQPKKKKKLLH